MVGSCTLLAVGSSGLPVVRCAAPPTRLVGAVSVARVKAARVKAPLQGWGPVQRQPASRGGEGGRGRGRRGKGGPVAAGGGEVQAVNDAVGTGGVGGEAQGAKFAVILEVEGVLADVHRLGHREAFNSAFREFGLDCSNWSEVVYADLLRQSGSHEPTMLRLFFGKIGWPTMIPTNEQEAFVKNLLRVKQGALESLAKGGGIPLRPEVPEFVDELARAGVPLAVLAATCRSGEAVAKALVQQLGPERAALVTVVGEGEVLGSSYGQLVLGDRSAVVLEDTLATRVTEAVAAEKQRVAAEVVAILSSTSKAAKVVSEVGATGVESTRNAIAALRAAAEVMQRPPGQCVLLAGGHPGLQAGLRAGMLCVVVRSSITARGEFQDAHAVVESFGGGGGVTLARLRRVVDTRGAKLGRG